MAWPHQLPHSGLLEARELGRELGSHPGHDPVLVLEGGSLRGFRPVIKSGRKSAWALRRSSRPGGSTMGADS
jgi:hypothetical protein